MSRELGGVRRAVIEAGYRIHLGFYRFLDPPYAYGGMGLSLINPKVLVTVEHTTASTNQVEAPTPQSRRIIKDALSNLNLQGVNVRIKGVVSHHVGLGCRTRLIAALLQGLKEIGLLKDNVEKYLRSLSKGSISAVGIYTFLKGGFVADTGLKLSSPRNPPSLLLSLKFPADWYVVLCIPECRPGLSEDKERDILNNVREHPNQDELYRYFAKLITAIRLGDFSVFIKALHRIQILTGKYFSEFQGGVFREEINDLVKALKRAGVAGIGQSSWGPTTYGFLGPDCRSLENALRRIYSEIEGVGLKCKVYLTRVRNGAGYKVIHYPVGKHLILE